LAGYFAVRLASFVPLVMLYPALWTLSEWLRCWLFSGFPWLLIGYSQIGTTSDAWAPLFGVLGVTWFVALISGLAMEIVNGGWRRRSLGLAAIVAFWMLAAVVKPLHWTQPSGDKLTVAVVQGNVAQEVKWQPEQRIRTLDLYRDLSEPYWQQDLIVWPETAIPAFSFQVADYLDWLEERSKRGSAQLLLGIPVYDPDNNIYFNSILALGNTNARYDKRHLVPFGEYLPFRSLLGPILDFLTIPMSQFSPGPDERSTLKLSRVVLGASVCYEDAFAELVADAVPEAELLVNVSNDAWFGDSLAPHQHMQIARMRARETERYMLRATNTGISALINQRGEIVSRSPQFQADVLTGEVTPLQGDTPFSRWRHRPVALACGLLVFISTWLRRRVTDAHAPNG
jgi:apolipoprotein N-acyltransferase